MKRKTLLTPVFQLDRPSLNGFVEFLVEPQPNRQNQPWFRHLQGLGLEKAIQLAERTLAGLEPSQRAVDVYWTNPSLSLNHTEGVALALALGVSVLDDRCSYNEIIVMGRLNPWEAIDGQRATIEDTGYTMPSLATVAALGFRAEPTCLILPVDPNLSPDRQALLAQIEQLGIDVYQVGTLDAAIAACLSVASEKARRS